MAGWNDNPTAGTGGESDGQDHEHETATAASEPTRFDQWGEPLDEAEFYCPGCGKRADYRRECRGTPESPHPPIEVVPTSELGGDPEKHTAAPNTGT